DEVDNVVRQISAKGHPACFRTLALYCSARELSALRVVCAMTPEMRTYLSRESRRSLGRALKDQQTVMPEECATYDQWDREANADDAATWQSCTALNPTQRLDLFRRIAAVHAQAWGSSSEAAEELMRRLS